MRDAEFFETEDFRQAYLDFESTWNDSMLAYHVGPKLTCTEVGVLADLLSAAGASEAADTWLEGHVDSDHDDEVDQPHALSDGRVVR